MHKQNKSDKYSKLKAIAFSMHKQNKSDSEQMRAARLEVVASGLEAIVPGWRPALQVYKKHKTHKTAKVRGQC